MLTEGYTKTLEVNGVGYRASKAGKKLTLNLGYSHPVEMEDPEDLSQRFRITRSSLRVSIKKKLASTQLRSEIREDLSHIRARESNMLMRLLDVKLVRLVKNN